MTRHWYIIDAKDQALVVLQHDSQSFFVESTSLHSAHMLMVETMLLLSMQNISNLLEKDGYKAISSIQWVSGGLRSQTARRSSFHLSRESIDICSRECFPRARLSRQVIEKQKMVELSTHTMGNNHNHFLLT